MKLISLLLLAATALFGFADSVQSFSADFTQTITDDSNKTITYRGRVEAVRPDKARWDYSAPVEKRVYVIGHKVTIIEPELEQAIVKRVDRDIDLFEILARARPLGDDTYLAQYETQQFLVKIKDDVLMAISYKDAFENRIRLLFSHQKINAPLEAARFEPNIPKAYDLLTE